MPLEQAAFPSIQGYIFRHVNVLKSTALCRKPLCLPSSAQIVVALCEGATANKTMFAELSFVDLAKLTHSPIEREKCRMKLVVPSHSFSTLQSF